MREFTTVPERPYLLALSAAAVRQQRSHPFAPVGVSVGVSTKQSTTLISLETRGEVKVNDAVASTGAQRQATEAVSVTGRELQCLLPHVPITCLMMANSPM